MQHRLKHLLWKTAWNILLVRHCFASFIDTIDQADWLCPFCKTAPETISHVFLDCSLARILWRSPPWPFNSEVFSNILIAELVIFLVTAMVLSDSNSKIIRAATKHLSTTDAAINEAQAALLASQIASSLRISSLILEGDAINIILAILHLDLFKD